MNNVKILFFLFSFFVIGGNKAQLTSPELVSSSGETFINNSLIIDFSIGELVIDSYNGSSILTQGFHQPSLEGTDNLEELSLCLSVFPNPTSSLLNLWFLKTTSANVLITDMNGRKVFSDKIQAKKQVTYTLDFLKPSVYYLSIENNHQKNIYVIQIF